MSADFGWRWWSEVNCRMLRPSLRETTAFRDNSPQTWEIVEYGDERSREDLVYQSAVNDVGGGSWWGSARACWPRTGGRT